MYSSELHVSQPLGAKAAKLRKQNPAVRRLGCRHRLLTSALALTPWWNCPALARLLKPSSQWAKSDRWKKNYTVFACLWCKQHSKKFNENSMKIQKKFKISQPLEKKLIFFFLVEIPLKFSNIFRRKFNFFFEKKHIRNLPMLSLAALTLCQQYNAACGPATAGATCSCFFPGAGNTNSDWYSWLCLLSWKNVC